MRATRSWFSSCTFAFNPQVADARARWSKARIERNSVMYGSEVSMIKTAQATRKYVRAIFGHDSEQYALVKSLEFKQRTL